MNNSDTLPQINYGSLDPIQLFNLFFTEELLNLIIDSTNYSFKTEVKKHQVNGYSGYDCYNSRGHNSKLLSFKELNIYLGFKLASIFN